MSHQSEPLISVIIPCYNQGNYLAEAIESVLAQTYSNWEAIIVDDGSTDHSAEVAKEYVQKDARVHYIYQSNAGPSAARNNGVKASSGQYIQFLDGDNKLSEQYLNLAVRYLETHPSCVLFYSRAMYFGERSDEFPIRWTGYEDMLCLNSIDCACCVRRTDFDRVGGFDEQLRGYEDWEFFIRLLHNHPHVYQSPEYLFSYRVTTSTNHVNAQAAARAKEIRHYIFEKNRTIYEEVFDAPEIIYSEYYRYRKALDDLRQSQTYRAGQMVLAPIKWLKSIFTTKHE